MSFGDEIETKILQHFFKGTSYTQATNLFVGLDTGIVVDTDTGLTVTEPGGNYVRATQNAWTIASNQVSNSSTVTFPTATVAYTAYSWFVCDAGAGDAEIVAFGPLQDTAEDAQVATAQDGATDKFFAIAHGYSDNDPIMLEAIPGQSLPTGASEGTIYYVVNSDATSFQIETSIGGGAVNLTADGMALVNRVDPKQVGVNDTPSFATDALVAKLT